MDQTLKVVSTIGLSNIRYNVITYRLLHFYEYIAINCIAYNGLTVIADFSSKHDTKFTILKKITQNTVH